MIQDSEYLKKQRTLQLYKESLKSPLKCYYLIMMFFIPYAIMAIISSIDLKNKYGYYENIQTAIIILVFYTIFIQCLGFYVLKKKELTSCIYQLVIFIFLTTIIPPLLQLFTFIQGYHDKYCGYEIIHQGYTKPHSIINYLETNSPGCSQMEVYGNLQEQIKYYSLKAIIQDCSISRSKDDNCYQFNILKVENWNAMFVMQSVSFSMGFVQIFISVIFLLSLKSKYAKATKKIEQEIRQNLLNQSSQQVCQNQLVYQQILAYNPQLYSQQPNSQDSFQAYNNQLNCNHPANIQNPQIQNQNQVYIVGQPISS
ncbi:hypothetical protein ABPG74_021131 [Tetrahymena malaccensis]